MKINQFALAAAVSVMLTACGGGSDSPDDTHSSSSSDDTSSSASSSSSSTAGGPNEYEGDWASCERLNEPQGFASLGDGVTGGADMGAGNYEVGVVTGTQIQNALSNAEYADKPLTLYVDDLITWENSNNNAISIRREDVTLIGRSENAGFEGVGIDISHGARNVIIRNLTLRLVPQAHSPGDLISMDGRNGGVSHVWIDHNELYNSRTAPDDATCANIGADAGCELDKDYYDELVSGRSEVRNVTISYNYMHDSWKTSLWGSSDSSAEDAGRTITFHHNYWHNVNSRLPLFRYGEAHIFNNYYHNVDGSGINSRMGAEMMIDGNVFENVNAPIVSQFSDEVGFWNVEDNIFIDISANGSCIEGGSECKGAHQESRSGYTPNYTYDIQPASDVKDYVMQYAGAGVLGECLDLPNPGENEAPGFETEPQEPPAAWNYYDGSALPGDENSIALATSDTASFEVGGSDEENYFSLAGDGTVNFDTTSVTSITHNATYRGVVNEGYPKHLTVLAGVTGVNEEVRILEIETAFSNEGEAGSRLKTLLRNQEGSVGIQLEDANAGESVDNYGDGLDMSVFRVYQISVTMTSATQGNVRIFTDGNDEPVISLLDVVMRGASSAGDNFVRMGDGGGHAYKGNVDWLVWTNEAAYLPSDLKGAIPETLGDITGYEAD